MEIKKIQTFRDKGQLKGYFLRDIKVPELDNRVSRIKDFFGYVRTSESMYAFQFISKEDEGYLAMKNTEEFYLFDKCPEGIFVTDGSYNIYDFDMNIISDENLMFIRLSSETIGSVIRVQMEEMKFETIKAVIDKMIIFEEQQKETIKKDEEEKEKAEKEQQEKWDKSEYIALEDYELENNTIKYKTDLIVTLEIPYGKTGLSAWNFDRYSSKDFVERLTEYRINFSYKEGEIYFKVKFSGGETFINGIKIHKDKVSNYIYKLRNGSDLEKIKKYPAYIIELEKAKEITYSDRSGDINIPISLKFLKDEFEIVFMDKTKVIPKPQIKELFDWGRGNVRTTMYYEKLKDFCDLMEIKEDDLLEYLKKKRTLNLLKKTD